MSFVSAILGGLFYIKKLLILVAGIVIILVALKVIGITYLLALASGNNLEKSGATEWMINSMADYNASNRSTFWLDYIQTTLECCGVNGPEDWLKFQPNLPQSCCQNFTVHSNVCQSNNANFPPFTIGCEEAFKDGIYDQFASNPYLICVLAAIPIESLILLSVLIQLCYWKKPICPLIYSIFFHPCKK